MARLRMEGVIADTEIPTPAAGTATIFYNSTERVYKVKLDDGSVAPIGSGGGGGGTWGSITGTLSSQTDLQNALDAKYDASNPDNFVDSAEAAAAAPVQSVAGQTGAVTLSKSDVGLSNVDNTSDADKPVSDATATALLGKYDTSNPALYVNAAQAAAAAPVQSVAGQTGAVNLSKTDVGLNNVDNTSDLDKPVSNATQSALDGLDGRLSTVEGEVVAIDSQFGLLTNAVAAKLDLSGGTMTGDINMESSGGSGSVTLFGMFLGNSGGLNTYAFTPAAPNTMDAPFQLLDGADVIIGDILFAPAMFELRYYAASGSSIPDVAGIDTIPIFAESTGTGIIQLQIQFSDTYMPMMPLKLRYIGAGAATNYKVVGLADAVNARDAVNKQQLDAAISAISVPVTSVAGKTGAVVLDKSDVSLNNVDNTSDADKPISDATATALSNKYDSSNPANYVDAASAAAAAPVQSVAGKTGVVTLDKADVGLSNVDNTADLDKPISTATQSALNDLTVATQDNASSLDDLTVYVQDIRTDLDLFVAPSGATRPASPVVGQIFFDTVLVKPIFYSGSAWVDATGTAV